MRCTKNVLKWSKMCKIMVKYRISAHAQYQKRLKIVHNAENTPSVRMRNNKNVFKCSKIRKIMVKYRISAHAQYQNRLKMAQNA